MAGRRANNFSPVNDRFLRGESPRVTIGISDRKGQRKGAKSAMAGSMKPAIKRVESPPYLIVAEAVDEPPVVEAS